MTPSGLRVSGIPRTAQGRAWLHNLVMVYLPAREYLAPFEARRWRVFDLGAWVRVLLARFTAEEYPCQLAVLNHAATSAELTWPLVERFLRRIAADAAGAVRHAMDGGIDGFRRWFLARQLVLHAMRQVLVPPELEASLREIDLETVAVLLVHLAGHRSRWRWK